MLDGFGGGRYELRIFLPQKWENPTVLRVMVPAINFRMVSSTSNHPNVLSGSVRLNESVRRKLSAPQYAMSLKLISFRLPVDGGATLVLRGCKRGIRRSIVSQTCAVADSYSGKK